MLEAARGLFAERGFHNATVRDIAARANTNLASINYYFRSKDDLYREVLSHSFRKAVDADEFDDAPHDIGSREDRLKVFIRGLIPRSVEDGESDQHMRLLAWEMLSPTGALDHIEETEIKPHLERAKEIVRPFLASDASPMDLAAAALWLVGQCLIFRGLAERVRLGFMPVQTDADHAERLVALVTDLSLRGLVSKSL
ncbi:CerR family C-terminal domain-containing protein [Parvibaculum sp.]|uniref:CerR family C-terminal domain-containing protein n=1 Tax=Parvibaculum sp. TaxID=2024848 RepID=UPI00320DEAD8